MARPDAAYVTYECALAVAESLGRSGQARRDERRGTLADGLRPQGAGQAVHDRARVCAASSSCATGCSRGTRLRCLLQLSYLYRELGDLYLASVLAKECLELAREESDRPTQAGVFEHPG